MEESGRKRKEPPQALEGDLVDGKDTSARSGWSYVETACATGPEGQNKRMRLWDPDWITPFCWMCRNPAGGASEKKSMGSRIVAGIGDP